MPTNLSAFYRQRIICLWIQGHSISSIIGILSAEGERNNTDNSEEVDLLLGEAEWTGRQGTMWTTVENNPWDCRLVLPQPAVRRRQWAVLCQITTPCGMEIDCGTQSFIGIEPHNDFCSHHNLCELPNNVLNIRLQGWSSQHPSTQDFVRFARHLLLFVHNFAG